jgi:hypothetical protein
LRRIAERQSRLRRGRMGHAISRDLAFEAKPTTPTTVDDSVNEVIGIRCAIKRAGDPATSACGRARSRSGTESRAVRRASLSAA